MSRAGEPPDQDYTIDLCTSVRSGTRQLALPRVLRIGGIYT